MFLEISQILQKNTCARDSFLIKVFSCEFCEISKSTFSIEHLWTTPSDDKMLLTDHGLQNSADIENNTIIMHNNAAIAHRVISAMKDFA